jgi:hypothetical protein
MVVIFNAIDPVELQQLRDFGSEANFVPHQTGELPSTMFSPITAGVVAFLHAASRSSRKSEIAR